jgi:hypothetical protein
MSDTPSVQVVQCPKCGSPVDANAAGRVVTCGFCGASLQLTAGISGYPIAALASIDTSTLYLAKTEALKALRLELEQKQDAIRRLQEYCGTMEKWLAENRPNWLTGRQEKEHYAEQQQKMAKAQNQSRQYTTDCSRPRKQIIEAQAELRDMSKRLS